MPNHVTNRLAITANTKEELDAFEAAFITPAPAATDTCAFSFEKFLPMPAILHRVVENGAAQSGKPISVYEVGATDMLDATRPATPEELAEITATGYSSWYSWAVANWGTKWDAYDLIWERISPVEAVLKFDTAWSVPEPVYEAMSHHTIIEPLHLRILAYDEGWGFAYEGEISGGEYTGALCDATSELYEAVYGEPPQVYEDEEPSDAEESTAATDT